MTRLNKQLFTRLIPSKFYWSIALLFSVVTVMFTCGLHSQYTIPHLITSVLFVLSLSLFSNLHLVLTVFAGLGVVECCRGLGIMAGTWEGCNGLESSVGGDGGLEIIAGGDWVGIDTLACSNVIYSGRELVDSCSVRE